jgi:hypothetical protein
VPRRIPKDMNQDHSSVKGHFEVFVPLVVELGSSEGDAVAQRRQRRLLMGDAFASVAPFRICDDVVVAVLIPLLLKRIQQTPKQLLDGSDEQSCD